MTVKEELTTLKKRSLIVDTEDEDDFEKISDEKNSDVILDQDSSQQPDEEQSSGILFYILERHQWMFAIWLIPISICYDIFMWFRARWNYWTSNHLAYNGKAYAKHLHREKVICRSQFYIQLVYRPHFGTLILLFGPFGLCWR